MIYDCIVKKKFIWSIDFDNIEDTREKLEQILKCYPESYTTYLYLGLFNIPHNSVSANYYFDKALTIKADLEQAWYYKGLLHINQHEFKNALECINKVLLINPRNFRAQNFKVDILFYLQNHNELDRYYLEIFNQRMNDNDFLNYKVVHTNDGIEFGKIVNVLENELIIRSFIAMEYENCRRKDMVDLIITKDKIMTFGEVIILNVKGKTEFDIKLYLNDITKLVIDNYGFIIGKLKEKQGQNLIINIGEIWECRYFNLLNRALIKLPSSGIISSNKGLIIYDMKELNPKDILTNTDPSLFFQRIFKHNDPFNNYLPLFIKDFKNSHPVMNLD